MPSDGRWRRLVRAQLGPLGLDPAREADIVDELAQHVAQHHADLVASGVDDEAAVERALAPLHDHLAREIARADRPRPAALPPPPLSPQSTSSGALLSTLVADVRYAIRVLRRSPGFAAAAILTLALGIGANTAIFSVVRAVLLNPPPYRDPSRVIALVNVRNGAEPSTITSASLPDYEDWRRELTTFEQLGLLSGWTFNVTNLDLPERLFGARVTGSLFPLLGTPALLGRTIEPADDVAGGDEVVVLGYRVWQRLFAGDRGIVGRTLMLEGRPHIVIGVMPPRFRFPSDDTEIWAAMKDSMGRMDRYSRFMVAIGRLAPGASLAAAQEEIDRVETRLERDYPISNRGWRVRLIRVQETSVRDSRPALLMLSGAVGFVLLIACANVANLLLARATARRRETAVRVALGASRRRIAAQWITENLLLAFTGGAVGVAMAYAIVPAIAAAGPADVPRLDEAAVDGVVLAFTAVVALIAGALPAVVPAILAARGSTQLALKDGSGAHDGGGPGHAGAALIVSEVALAMALAVAGTLLLQSLARLTAVPPGFDAARVLTLKTFLTPPRYRAIAPSQQYVQDALDRIAAVPGVEAVGSVSQLPMGDPSSTLFFAIDGRPVPPGERPSAGYRSVSPSYFDAMRIPILRGRGLTAADRSTTEWVAVVNAAFVNRHFAGQDPLGQRIRWAADDTTPPDARWLTIVGVVPDVKSHGLDRPEAPAVYTPFTQRDLTFLRWTTFVVRTASDPAGYARTLRQELARVDPMQPIYQIAPLESVIAGSTSARRFETWLIELFAGLAIVLASIGVYGTVGYWVAGRAREIGVRMALGATARRITLLIVGRTALLAAIGVAIGAVIAAGTMRTLAALMFDVRPFEPSAIAMAAVLVAGVAIGAACPPARRAARLDPLSVIRGD